MHYSFASASFPLGQYAEHPVTFYNVKTKAPVTITLELDTGTLYTELEGKYAKQLGIDNPTKNYVGFDEVDTLYGTEKLYMHRIAMKVGNLKPIATRVYFNMNPDTADHNLLGVKDFIESVRTQITKDRITYTELAALAMVNSAAYFRSRI